jgi:hypothetical protein
MRFPFRLELPLIIEKNWQCVIILAVLNFFQSKSNRHFHHLAYWQKLLINE